MKKGAHATATMATISSASSAAAAPVGDDGVEQMPRSRRRSSLLSKTNFRPSYEWSKRPRRPQTRTWGNTSGTRQPTAGCGHLSAAGLFGKGSRNGQKTQTALDLTPACHLYAVVSIFLMVNRAACIE